MTQEIVMWQYRHWNNEFTAKPGWSEWIEIKPSSVQTVEQIVRDFKHYIANGYRYEIRPLVVGSDKELLKIPLAAINQIVGEAMDVAVSNGANSISMPDEYVAVAHFVCFPEEYGVKDDTSTNDHGTAGAVPTETLPG